MKKIDIANPFGAPVYHEETVSSTMDVCRLLARDGEAHGTVITADYQNRGRGRGQSRPGHRRPWNMERDKNLACTILLRYDSFPASAIPPGLTLRAGLAVSLGVEDFAPALGGAAQVKWPNDIMLGRKKAAGILTEADGSVVYIGIGININQREFPAEYRAKATSITLALEAAGAPPAPPAGARFTLLENIIARLYGELETPAARTDAWRRRLDERLYMKGRAVRFIEGQADSGRAVHGILTGIGPGGELLIIPQGETVARPFVNGELDVYD
jgi:BirA family biotin operon repressor/biotin-[acetyl-CoA-carboxylase] ligase